MRVALCILLLACARRPPGPPAMEVLAADLVDQTGQSLGRLEAAATPDGLAVVGRLWGLPAERERRWAVEMRSGTRCVGPGFSGAGDPWGPGRSVGWGPLLPDARGGAEVRVVDPSLTLRGVAGVQGRTVVLVPEGATGAIACAVWSRPKPPRSDQPQMTDMWEF